MKRFGDETVLGLYGGERLKDAGKPIVNLSIKKNLLVSNTAFQRYDKILLSLRPPRLSSVKSNFY